MPTSNAASVHARASSNPTPPAKVNHEPSEISEISRAEEPSLRYLMMLLAAGARPAGGLGCWSCRPGSRSCRVPSLRGWDLDTQDGAAPGRARDLQPAAEVADAASDGSQAEMIGAHGGRVEAAAIVGHLDRHGVVRCGDADRGPPRPGVLYP